MRSKTFSNNESCFTNLVCDSRRRGSKPIRQSALHSFFEFAAPPAEVERGDLSMLDEFGEARDFGRLYLAPSQSKRAVVGEYSEAVQQIARFLRDPRPKVTWSMDQLIEGGAPAPLAVRRVAGVYLVRALGEDSPIKPRPFYKLITLAEAEVLADWWDSDASLPWRQPKIAAVIQEPEQVKAPVKEETAKPKVDATPAPPSPPQEGEWLPPLLLILAGVGLVVWIAAQSNRRRG